MKQPYCGRLSHVPKELCLLQVSSWLEYATYIVGGGALEPACRTLNEALSMRTFLAGYSLSVADMAIWGQLQGGSPFCKSSCIFLCTFLTGRSLSTTRWQSEAGSRQWQI